MDCTQYLFMLSDARLITLLAIVKKNDKDTAINHGVPESASDIPRYPAPLDMSINTSINISTAPTCTNGGILYSKIDLSELTIPSEKS